MVTFLDEHGMSSKYKFTNPDNGIPTCQAWGPIAGVSLQTSKLAFQQSTSSESVPGHSTLIGLQVINPIER